MKSGKKQILPGFVLACAIVAVLPVLASASEQDAAANYDIRVSLYRRVDDAERAMPQASWTMATIPVPADVKSIRELLVSNHINFDSDAVGLLFALNPDLGDVLSPGDKIRFIQVLATQETAKAISDGFVLKIYYDDSIIRNLVAAREKILDLAADFSRLPPERFESGTVRQKSMDCITGISHDFKEVANVLEYRDQPTNHEALSQLRGDVQLVVRTLEPTLTGNQRVTAVDQATMCEVANDLRIKREGFEGTRGPSLLRFPRAHLLVNTYDSVTHNPVTKLRIHFVAAALQNDPLQEQTFSALSPVDVPLPEADYVFWVTKDGDTTPISGRTLASVRQQQDSKPQILEILVKP
ncbi:MAG TPA: hypothetical protein VFE61_01730 [Candidatus Sulfotelmatobacter sp.]|nr:hypothetical protein [Candidatus Sulfotelmatobacter sp.]